ncbi:MAG: AMP-binding protein [Acutalibacteraceae bacterium]
MKLQKRIESALASYGDRTAVKLGEESIRYHALRQRAEKNAALLKRQGTGPVIVYGSKSIFQLVMFVSCLLAKRAYIPIDTCWPEKRIQSAAKTAGAALLLSETKLNIPGVACCNEAELEQYEAQPVKKQTDETAYIIFTSGSTGNPKGVPVSRDNLDHFIGWIGSLYPLSDYEGIRVMNKASFCFDLSVADIYYSLCGGHTLVLEKSDPNGGIGDYIDALGQNEITLAVATPTFIRMCLFSEEFCKKKIPSLRCIFFCGEQLEPATVRKLLNAFPGLEVLNAYGPTESTCAVSAARITPDMLDQPVLPVGEPENSAVKITVEHAEIVLVGKSVCKGYLNGENGGFFTRDGQNGFCTGDIGYFENGKLFCKGRKNAFIKFKGYRIELADIEHNLMRLPGVQQCAVIADYGKNEKVRALRAFVVPEDGADSQESEMKKELSELLPDYMIPKTIRFLSEMPLNKNGKLDRKGLCAL